MRGARSGLILCGLALTGCSKASDSSAARETPPAASASADPRPSAAPKAAAGPEAWSGHYTASPGSISIPDAAEWAGVKFRGEDAAIGLGEGAISLSVSDEGRVQGTLDGPLGPLRVTGELAGNAFSAALAASDPGHGFAGTATGTQSGERIEGTMRLSLPTGNVLREGTFTLERKH